MAASSSCCEAASSLCCEAASGLCREAASGLCRETASGEAASGSGCETASGSRGGGAQLWLVAPCQASCLNNDLHGRLSFLQLCTWFARRFFATNSASFISCCTTSGFCVKPKHVTSLLITGDMIDKNNALYNCGCLHNFGEPFGFFCVKLNRRRNNADCRGDKYAESIASRTGPRINLRVSARVLGTDTRLRSVELVDADAKLSERDSAFEFAETELVERDSESELADTELAGHGSCLTPSKL